VNELVNSVKADLTDRRLLPAVIAVGVLLVAGLAYALLGGGSSAPESARGPVAAPVAGGIAVAGTTPEKAVAETTDGYKEQQGGSARNPFTPLPGSGGSTSTTAKTSAPAAATAASSSSSSSGSGEAGSGESAATGGGSSGSGSSGSGSSGPAPAKHASKPKPQSYRVALEFGQIPPGTPAKTATLTPYENVKLQTPLPSTKQALVVFRGVTAKGKSATFTLLGEALIAGQGACLPSAQQCQAVDLQPGQYEQLSFLQPDGSVLSYELRVVTIAPVKAGASAARAHAAAGAGASGPWQVSRAGLLILRHEGLFGLPYLRYSSRPGVLVFAAPAKHAAAHRGH